MEELREFGSLTLAAWKAWAGNEIHASKLFGGFAGV